MTSLSRTEALTLALRYKHLTSEFYTTGLDTIISTSSDPFTEAVLASLQVIATQELKHRDALVQAIGSSAPPSLSSYNFTAGGTTTGPFPDVLTNGAEFLKVSQLLEDTGVRLLKGLASALTNMDAPTLTLIMRIHQGDARHAARIRRIRNQDAWITGASFDSGFSGASTTAGTQAAVATLVYGIPVLTADVATLSNGEDNRVQGGIPGQSASVFDEPFDVDTMHAVVALFGVSL